MGVTPFVQVIIRFARASFVLTYNTICSTSEVLRYRPMAPPQNSLGMVSRVILAVLCNLKKEGKGGGGDDQTKMLR